LAYVLPLTPCTEVEVAASRKPMSPLLRSVCAAAVTFIAFANTIRSLSCSATAESIVAESDGVELTAVIVPDSMSEPERRIAMRSFFRNSVTIQ
jgi:hypothetical protein